MQVCTHLGQQVPAPEERAPVPMVAVLPSTVRERERKKLDRTILISASGLVSILGFNPAGFSLPHELQQTCHSRIRGEVSCVSRAKFNKKAILRVKSSFRRHSIHCAERHKILPSHSTQFVNPCLVVEMSRVHLHEHLGLGVPNTSELVPTRTYDSPGAY